MIAGASTDFGSDGHVTMTDQRTGEKNERHVAHFAARGGPLINSIDQHPVQVPLIYLVGGGSSSSTHEPYHSPVSTFAKPSHP